MAHLGDRVAAFVDGQLSDDDHAAALEHLSRCAHCRDAVDQQDLLKHRMTGLHHTPAPSASLLSTLADPERLPRRQQRSLVARIWHLRGLRTLVALTGASLTVTFVAYAVGSPAQEDDDVVSPPVEQFVSQFGATSAVAMRPISGSTTGSAGIYRLAASDRRAPGGPDSAEAVALLRAAAGSDQTVSLALLEKNYDLSIATTARIDGVEATEVVAGRDGRVAASFWIAKDGGTLVRTIAYDRSGATVSQSDAPLAAGRPGSAATTSTINSQIPADSLRSLQKSGWPCHDTLAHDLQRVDSSWVDDRGEQIVSHTYTDGISTMALFEQSGTLGTTRPDGFGRTVVDGSTVWVRRGNPTVATWGDGDVVYTIVTDADRHSLTSAVADLPLQRSENGRADRVRTGVRRISSWIDPTR